MDSNRGPQGSEATALPTKPQPLPKYSNNVSQYIYDRIEIQIEILKLQNKFNALKGSDTDLAITAKEIS